MFNRLQHYAEMMSGDPLGFVIYLLTFAAAILISLILHEIAHGYVAFRCGDPTAKMLGRLSLRPSHHLDPIGTACMVLLGVGWAKPVPINPRYFRRQRRDVFLVSIAGIVTNLLLFMLCTALSVVLLYLTAGADFRLMVSYTDGHNAFLAMKQVSTRSEIYDLFIGYLLDGSAVSELSRFMAVPWLQHVLRFFMLMGQINLSLALFNLLPIPPLDGYQLVNASILRGRLQLNAKTFRIAQLALLVLCWTGALTGVLGSCISFVSDAVIGLFVQLIP